MKKLMVGLLVAVLVIGVGIGIGSVNESGGGTEIVPLSPGGGGIGGNKPS